MEHTDKIEMTTLTDVLQQLREKEYINDYNIKNNLLLNINTEESFKPEELLIDKVFRFEGESDPGDMSVVYSISTNSGSKGVLIDAYGTYADASVNDFIKQISIKTDTLHSELFPLSAKYDKDWIQRNSLGENVLYNLESLCEIMEFKPGMRVLDIGCGKAISAIFLAIEFGVKVWAIDEKVPVDENNKRIEEMNGQDNIYPLNMDVRSLPFPKNYFDAIIAVDSFMYYGTDEKFIPYICQYLKVGGSIGIIDICFKNEVNSLAELPMHMRGDFTNKWYFVHSLQWWERMWKKSALLKVLHCEIIPQNGFVREEYVKDMKKNNKKNDFIADAIDMDKDFFINIFRMVAKRTEKEVFTESL